MAGYHHSDQPSPYPETIPLVHVLVAARLLWGRDWPPMPGSVDLFDLLLDWVPDERDRARILVDNPEAF